CPQKSPFNTNGYAEALCDMLRRNATWLWDFPNHFQSLMSSPPKMLNLLPPAILLWRTFEAGGGALNLLVPVLVMAAGPAARRPALLHLSGDGGLRLHCTP